MKLLPGIDAELAEWIGRQHVFFVGTAPLSSDGHVNVSPKGGDCFRILGEHEVAYLDFTGSGAETAAHVRENGRIVVMFCAFEGKPEIVRLHGRAELIDPDHEDFPALATLFPPNLGVRAVFRIRLDRVSTSCGYAVPFMDYRKERNSLDKWAKAKGPEGLENYRQTKNGKSIDGLPALG